MSSTRLDLLRNLVAQNPADSFARYGLAQEWARSGNLEQAVEEYRGLLAVNPDYAAAYYHGGQALARLGRIEEARALYRLGIETTTRIGDLHTRGEIEAALETLG